ncbi:MAG TPA: hypothetical protein PLE30_04685 [Candidatus Kapabacteria bacterium]|nr:hypothetical protein [Candidatus Kapabacteria bacterium]
MNNEKNEKEKKRTLFYYIRRILLILILFFFIGATSLVILVNFQFFRSWALNRILSIVNNELTSKIEVDDLYFSLINGIILKDARLLVAGDTLAQVREINLSLNISKLINNDINVYHLKLIDAKVRLLRSKDSTWNFDKIAAPSQDTSNSDTKIKIFANKMIFQNVDFLYYDSTSVIDSSGIIDFSHFHFKDVQLETEVYADLYNSEFKLNINNLHLIEGNTKAKVDDLKGELGINTNGPYAKNITGKLDKSEFVINASLDNFNAFTEKAPLIEQANIKLDLITHNFDSKIVDYFYIMPIKVGRIHDGYINISGNLYDLEVKKLNIISDEQEIYISGKLFDIPEAKKFHYYLDLSNSQITENTLKQTLPTIDFSAFPMFERINSNKLIIKGNTHYINSDLNLITSMGDIKGQFALDFNKLAYQTNLEFANADLSKIIRNNDIKSNLNGNLIAKGSNFDIENLLIDLNLELNNSKFRNLNINSLTTKLNIRDKKVIRVDSVQLNLSRTNEWAESKYDDFYNNKSANIYLAGLIDINNFKNPKYDLNIKLDALDLNQLLLNEKLPDHLSGNISVNGSGINLDSLKGDYQFTINELLFKDRAIFPFVANIKFDKQDSIHSIIIDSDYLNANLNGNFVTSQLISGLSNQANFLSNFIENKLDKIKPDFVTLGSESGILKKLIVKEFPKINGSFYADIKDISIINTLIDSLELNSQMLFKMDIYSDNKNSTINIDTLDIQYLKIKNNDFIIQANNLVAHSKVSLEIKDTILNFKRFNIDIPQSQFFVYNNTILYEPTLKVDFDGETLNFSGSVGFNEQLRANLEGNLILQNGGVDLNIDNGALNFQDSISWVVSNPFTVNSYGEYFKIDNFKLTRNNFESLEIQGSIKDNIAENMNIHAQNLLTQNLVQIFAPSIYEDLSTLKLTIDTLNLNINGDLKSPDIKLNFQSDSLYFNNVAIGSFNGDLRHSNNFIQGNIVSKDNISNKVINLEVNSLPIYLGLDTNLSIIDTNRIFDIKLLVSKLPAGMLEPFASGVNRLKGDVDANIAIRGYLPDKIKWGGECNINNGEFWVDNTNIKYLAEAKTVFEENKLKINQMIVKNRPDDVQFGRVGSASITGYVNIDNFKPGYMDLKIKTDRILALSDASSAKMPELYGNFIMTTGEVPLRFFGTLQEPNLEGDINVMYANIKMPLFEKRKSVRTTFDYHLEGDRYKVKIKNSRDTITHPEDEVKTKKGSDLLDLMNLNLRIKLLGQFAVKMDMELIGEMNALIGVPDKTVPLIYQKKRYAKDANLFGEVIVKEQSIIKSLKQFNTYGNVSFPTGSIENPTLDLIATHTGTSYSGNIKTQYLIKMYITGTKLDPKVKFQYFINGEEGTGSQEQINEDALYLLALGRTKNSVTQTQGNNSLINEGLVSGFSNFANKALSELLASTGVIQSAALDFRGGAIDLDQATVKFSGQIYGGISWTFGGSLSDISGNNEITLDIPASEFLENQFWSNFILQFTKASSTTTIVTQDAKNWEIKVKFGNSW